MAQVDTEGSRHLLTLPEEIRAMIFELCVVVGNVPYCPPNAAKEFRDFDMRITTPTESPQVQLFRVCKQIHSETRKIFLKTNTFIVLANCSPGHKQPRLPLAGLYSNIAEKKLIRHLSINLDYRNFTSGFADYNFQRGLSMQIWSMSSSRIADESRSPRQYPPALSW